MSWKSKTIHSVIAATFLAAADVHAQAATATETRGVGAVLEAELRRTIATGAAIGLVARDSIILLAGYGQAGLARDEPVTADLLFGAVHVDDVFTALAALALAERGTLDLDAPIRTYAPDLPPRVGSITMSQLLSHTGGLDDAEDEPPRRRVVSKVWPGATDRAVFTEPGAIHSVSRYSYRLVRAILESQTGEPLEQLIRRLVLEPAGATGVVFDAALAERLGAASAHAVGTTSARPVAEIAPAANPQPQVYASASDLTRLLSAWLKRTSAGAGAVSPSSFAAMNASRAARPVSPGDSVGYAVRVTRFLGHRQVSYARGDTGYSLLIRLIPELGTGVVILANGTGAIMERTADAALEFAIRLAAPGESMVAPASGDPTAITSPAEPSADDAHFAGTYANGDRIIVLAMRDGRLHWIDADLALPVQRQGARFEAVIEDGRVAQVFHWARDAAGHDYLIVRERAFRR